MPICIHLRARRAVHQRGVTLTELAIVLAIIAVLMTMAVPNTLRWQRDQRLKGAARDIADLLLLARADHRISIGVGGSDNKIVIQKSGTDISIFDAPDIDFGRGLIYWRELH